MKTLEKVAGRYSIKKLLGRGGFGAVYAADDELEERPVALKVIRGDATLDPRGTRSRPLDEHSSAASRLSRGSRRTVTRVFGSTRSNGDDVTEAFKDEFRLLTQLHHPNLAAVYEFGRCEDDGVYFTQELVDGVYLSDFLKDQPREVIVDIFVQLARALDYIHALGLVHEDIKPSNVLVTVPKEGGSPQAKLIDFGLARMFRTKAESAEEQGEQGEIVVLGTPGFSAPEKIRGQKTDSRSDIYSLAATMYAAIRNQRPFPSKNFKEALQAQLDWRPELAGALLGNAGPVVAELVGRMLQPNPENRPQSARSIVLELLRRESTQIQDVRLSREDRADFARVLVEHLPFVDRSGYLDLMLTRAADILMPESNDDSSRSGIRNRLIRTIVIETPEGMGKQRLMAELRREIQLGGGLFVEASCWTTDRTVLGPFGPIVLQLATALGEKSPLPSEYSDLLRLARNPEGEEKAAGKLMEFLLAAAQEKPYVIHLSDLAQGQNELTRFDQLCRAIEHNESPILLCGTTTPHARITPTLTALNRDQVAEQWGLRPFNKEEMHEVLGGILGETAVLGELVNMLDKLTGGHPLSFRETLRVLIEEGILVRDTDSWTLRGASAAAEELHKTLAQRSESRLDGQGVSAWEIASVLYLVEAPISERQLEELSELRKGRFQRTLQRLEGEGLIIRNTSSRASQISLAHESVREAVRRRYEDSLDETRLDLAARIEELETDDPNFVFLRARLLDDASQTLESLDALEEASDRLFELGQPQLASQILERLIRRLRQYGGTVNIKRLLRAKLTLLNKAVGTLEDPQTEAAHYEAGILIAELLRDYRAQSLFWLGLADRHTNGTDSELALRRLERAAATAKLAHDRVLELRIANRRAEVFLGMGELEQANQHSKEAMKIFELPEAEESEVCNIVGVRLRCLSVAGHLDQARELHERSKAIAERVPVVLRQSYMSGIAFISVLGGEPKRGIPEMKQAYDELREANATRLLPTLLHKPGRPLPPRRPDRRSGRGLPRSEPHRQSLRARRERLPEPWLPRLRDRPPG